MAQAPTLCEVSYDSEWISDEYFYTPFRLPTANNLHHEKLRKFVYPRHSVQLPTGNDNRRSSFNCVGLLKSGDFSPKDTYYEFLRDYYIEHSSSPITFITPRTRGGTVASPQLPSRPYSTIPTVLPVNGYISPVHYDPNLSNHPVSLPALSRLHHRDDSPEPPPSDDKLIWNDTLNAWVSDKKYNGGKPYLSFINNPPYVEKLFTATEGRTCSLEGCTEECRRYKDHMLKYDSRPPSCICPKESNPRALAALRYRQSILERRNRERAEAPNKRAQRKAYSTPLYNKQRKVKFTSLSARNNYPSRSVPSPTSPDKLAIEELQIDDVGEAAVPETTDKHQAPLTDRITEVFGKDTHDVKDVKEVKTEPSLENEVKRELKKPSCEAVVKAIVREHSDHSPSKIVVPVPNSTTDVQQSLSTTGITNVSVLVKQESQVKPVPKLLPKRSQNVQIQSPKVEPKQQLPKLPVKEEVKVIPPKKSEPEKADKEKKAKVIPAPSVPKPKPKGKLWTALPKFELKSPKPAKKSSGLIKKNKEIFKPQPLPISLPDEIRSVSPSSPPSSPKSPIINTVTTQTDIPPEPVRDVTPPISVQEEEADKSSPSKRSRSPIKKKEKVFRNKENEENIDGLPDSPDILKRKQSSWIFSQDSDSGADSRQGSSVGLVKFDPSALPTAPGMPDVIINEKKRPLKTHVINKHLMPVNDNKQRWGAKKFDSSYEDEQRRAELAERRRKKQLLMYQKLKLKKTGSGQDMQELINGASFDDYDFLGRYCIFTQTVKKDMLQHAFNVVDDNMSGWLDCNDTMTALRSINNNLTYNEEEYLYRVLEMTGYNVADGADFKLFSVLAALSLKITSLDAWMRNIIGQMDFKILEMKLFMCKKLWECNVNKETNTILLEQLMIELRAGGVSYKHECQVRRKLSHMKSLDLFDFLTYIPLFIMIHESVVDNPLDDSRNK